MKKIIATICIIAITLIVLYKISLNLYLDKIRSIVEYDKISIKDFLEEVQTGDIIQIINRFNPRFLQYTLLGLINGTFYLHSAIVIKDNNGVPYLIHMQIINNKQYKRHSPNINNNTGGIYIEKLEDVLKLYIKRYGSLFGWYRIRNAYKHKFKRNKIIKSAFSIKDIKYTTNREIAYHIWRRMVNSRKENRNENLPRKSAQCNIVIGTILEKLRIFKKSRDIYSEYTPDQFEGLLDKCGAYEGMRQMKVIL